MSVSIAIASGAAAQSAIATQQAHEAKVISCKGFVHGYEHEKATTAEMRQYSECVRLLTPSDPMPAGSEIVIKVCIVILLLAFVTGMFKVDGYNDGLFDRFMNGFIYAFFGFVVIAVIFLILAGIGFLFS